MTDQAGPTSGARDARADSYCLSQEASIQAHLQVAKKAIASGENDLRRAAEHISEARKQGASQRRIAAAIGKSVSTVNRYLKWHKSEYLDETPFGPESQAKRQRARVRATERSNGMKRPRGGVAENELAAALTSPQVTQAESGRAKAGVETAPAHLATNTLPDAPSIDCHLPQELNRRDPEQAFQLLAEQWRSNPVRHHLLNSPQAAQLRFPRDVVLPEVGGPAALKLLASDEGSAQ